MTSANLKPVDVVQVVNMGSSDFPHPFYPMIGIVCDTRKDSQVGVFFPCGILDIDPKTGLQGSSQYFEFHELGKIGQAVFGFNYDEINAISDKIKQASIEQLNRDGFLDSSRREKIDN